VAGSPTSFWVEVLTENEWSRLRDIRLTALRDHPAAFLSSYEVEADYDEQRWRQEFSRGEWNIMLADGKEIGLLGVTRLFNRSSQEYNLSQEYYLEYLWVAREFRRSGAGSRLLRTVLDRLRDSGVHTVWLYILDGNEDARRLYQSFGFQSTNERQPLPNHPAGTKSA
jgi:ribosomal protein S18 acetylase RimI-like enzyme